MARKQATANEWGKSNSYTLLVGLQTRGGTMEISNEGHQKKK
jgi:hypothetical protein